MDASCRVFWNNYVCLALSAAMGLCFSMTFMKFLTEEVPVFQGIAARSLFGGTVLIVACWQRGVSLFEPREKICLFIARGITGALTNICLFSSSALLPLSEAAFMSNSFPGKRSLGKAK